ncbi:MAG: DnaJ domain-containing protein [Scytolyngbya sp. HA4215-MV1]|nr:DnaJ domain-containing protein [Scytolyngbya sp. HA4215-MV1]
MAISNHYQTLNISPEATQLEIKKAYRRLAKLFHPDSNQAIGNHDQITQINAAYEVLGDPQSRQSYDRQLQYHAGLEAVGFAGWDEKPTPQQRTAAAQRHYQRRQTGQDADEQLEIWLSRVYVPVNRLLARILNTLDEQIDDLAADPFDDELMEDFQDYLEDCRQFLGQAQAAFRSLPNPPTVAGVAAHLYYCLNQVSDGIEELSLFTLNYDDHYLHVGQEMFRIARRLRREAQFSLKEVTASR